MEMIRLKVLRFFGVSKIIDDLCDLRSSVSFFTARLDRLLEMRPLPAARQRVYVTLRGFYKQGDKEVVHGWTQSLELEDDVCANLPFSPFEEFRCERVDVLGPAVILGARVANRSQEFPKFEAPATFEFSATAEPGNCITVQLKGTP